MTRAEAIWNDAYPPAETRFKGMPEADLAARLAEIARQLEGWRRDASRHRAKAQHANAWFLRCLERANRQAETWRAWDDERRQIEMDLGRRKAFTAAFPEPAR